MGSVNEHVEPLLDRYRTGELSSTERSLVEGHLETCATCAEALKELEAFSATVARGYDEARAEGPEPDWAGMRQRVVARTSKRRPRGTHWARYVPQAAVATIAIIAVGVLLRQGVREPGDADRVRPLERPAVVGGRAAAPEASAERIEPAEEAVLDGARRQAEARRRAREDVAVGDELDDMGAVAGAADPVGQARRERNQQFVSRDAAAPTLDQEKARAEAGQYRENKDALAKQDAPGADEARRALEGALETETLADLDVVDRFELRAKRAFANRDTAAARASSLFFADSVAGRDDLDPERLRFAQSWADSLAALLAAQP